MTSAKSQANASGPIISRRGSTMEHRIIIGAPPAGIWSLLADPSDWGRWNPLYPRCTGVLREGETLNMSIALPGLKLQTVRATVVSATPDRELRYLTSSLGGTVIGHRYVTIETVAPGRCEVVNGERLAGLLGPLVARAIGAKAYEGFKQMNEALKAAAETATR